MISIPRFSAVLKLFFSTAVLFSSVSQAATLADRLMTLHPSCSHGSGSWTFTYTGAVQNFTVPANCSSVTIKAWGAGGGASSPISGFGSTDLGLGGTGGFVSGVTSGVAGSQISIYVGQGGAGAQAPFGAGGMSPDSTGSGGAAGSNSGNGNVSAGGGARTSVYLSGTLILVAGGGGGSAVCANGGNAGGTTGYSGAVASNQNPSPATGGSSTAPGTGGAPGANGGTAGSNGSSGNGGAGAAGTNPTNPGGGGGGGYFGGGGGGSNTNFIPGGGGGGSSYTAPTLTSAINTAGPNASDPCYANNAAAGGAPNGGSGGNGMVVIICN